jgi:hypothetical protein
MPDIKSRVVSILIKPEHEWNIVAVEQTDPLTLTVQYIAILAAIPAAARFVGNSLIGVTTFMGTHVRTGFAFGIVNMVVEYALTISAVYVAALVVDKLAPTFKSYPLNWIPALKLVAYASTAAWVAGILNVVPAMGPLAFLAGLYSVYLFYLGMQPVMKTPDDQVLPYMVVSAVVVFMFMLVAGGAAGRVTSLVL